MPRPLKRMLDEETFFSQEKLTTLVNKSLSLSLSLCISTHLQLVLCGQWWQGFKLWWSAKMKAPSSLLLFMIWTHKTSPSWSKQDMPAVKRGLGPAAINCLRKRTLWYLELYWDALSFGIVRESKLPFGIRFKALGWWRKMWRDGRWWKTDGAEFKMKDGNKPACK